jgi:hypothetical protein
MVDFLSFLVLIGLIGQAAIGLGYLVSSIWEQEKRASFFAGVQFLAMAGALILLIYWWASGFLATASGIGIVICLLVGGIAIGIMLIRKTHVNQKALEGARGCITGDVKRFDERDVVFARNRTIRPGSEQFKAYYQMRPEYEEFDAARRDKGGPLGQPGIIDRPKDRPNIAATFSSQGIALHLSPPEAYQPAAHPELKGQRVEMSPQEASQRVRGYTLNIGAKLVGVTEINPLWVYSHRGEIFRENWEEWGQPIEVHHKLAAYIANLGYSATANHLRHYDTLLVPLAVDAGLGEVGRLGYLMTKDYGPRIRLSAVTTDLPLVADSPVDIGVEHFCKICKKCANCCPSNSIPLDDPTEVNGTLRWKLNAETCFDYWGKVGTDCNVCMRVCPWSHVNTFPHKIIRALITRNRLSRTLFNLMDDIFYGKKPKSKPAPKWAQYE